LSYKKTDCDLSSHWYNLADYSASASTAAAPTSPRRRATPDTLILKAKYADDVLRQYNLLYGRSMVAPHFLPSLALLASAAFDRLSGVPPLSVKRWADAMVLAYLENIDEESPPLSEVHCWTNVTSPDHAAAIPSETVVAVLRNMLHTSTNRGHAPSAPRPCGYVFKRGDIAWNCRTCQTDPTCVICDTCFRNSNHEGHEVYFHRTTPGGCCDCGDAEAWKSSGCCPLHRHIQDESIHENDPEEAVMMALRGQKQGIDALQDPSTKLPDKLAAALGVVIGAAVHALVQAVDGAGIGADPVQWKLRWTDEACRIKNMAINRDDYYLCTDYTKLETPQSLLQKGNSMPKDFKLHLRLHNDDVHTFDEVIDALHEPRHNRLPEDAPLPPLVANRDDAEEMTHHVDADGQVMVKSYQSIALALQGYRRLKSKQRGLHCAVVGTSVVDAENRARALTLWLSEISAAHPAAAALVVHALVQLNHDLAGIQVWHEARSIPAWASLITDEDDLTTCRRRFYAFPPHLASSYVTREDAETLHRLGMEMNSTMFQEMTGTDPNFYSNVPYRLPSERYRKSPHALWGTLPSTYSDSITPSNKHPLLYRLSTGLFDEVAGTMQNQLTEEVYVVDTDLRKQEESERILASVYSHKLPGVHMISGVGTLRVQDITAASPPMPNPMQWRHLLQTCSFRAPVTPLALLLLLDPYPTKQVRFVLHSLFLSLLVDSRFKCRFAAALGAVAYRPLSTLFCAGVGTEADTPLGFTVQIFTAGSLVRALGNATAIEKLLKSDNAGCDSESTAPIGVFAMPLAHNVVRCIHTNLLGATKEVHMILKNTITDNDEESHEEDARRNDNLLPALTYQAGEHPLSISLPAAPDDGYLDSRSTRHKRLPHLLRDLEYVIETPGTAIRLLLPQKYPMYRNIQSSSSSPIVENVVEFATVYARLLRTAQGMDPQKRVISGGHVEYEKSRWLDAFGLSLNFAGTRDALAESLTNASSSTLAPYSDNGSHLASIQNAMGNLFVALLRELKLWLYREGMLETGLPLPPSGTHGGMDSSLVEALQRSTLHVSSSQLGAVAAASMSESSNGGGGAHAVALACATGVKMTEAQLELIEGALRLEDARRHHREASDDSVPPSGPPMGDWLRIPHSPLGGDNLSFHLPLHRSLAKSVLSICYVVVPESVRNSNPYGWWKLPVLDDNYDAGDQSVTGKQHPLVSLIRPTLRSSNCRVVWAAGPDCSSAEAHHRRTRSKNVSANIAAAKIIHSLADHPIRCLAAAQQIERHLWARNGTSTAGMALNYASSPLCRSFRDLDITLVQLSSAGMSMGLGARRVFSLLVSRFSMDGYLCDPERRIQGASSPTSSGNYAGNGSWVNPPRMQDTEHAVALSESFFTTMCIVVTELPSPPPISPSDEVALRSSLRRELLHALAAEPRSHSEAMEAATSAASRRDESAGISGGSSGGGALGDVFTQVLREVGQQKNQGSSRATSGPSAYELRPECSDEYDPTFFHLRRQDHQHAMDTIARLRKQKAGKDADSTCYPVVSLPPKSHPRFVACRLLLHLPSMDAALRRALLFAVTGGAWLPPNEPAPPPCEKDDDPMQAESSEWTTVATGAMIADYGGAVPVSTLGRKLKRTGSSSVSRRSGDVVDSSPFSPAVVAGSSVSYLEVLQLLTLQVHTLEECACLHRLQPDLDEEAKILSSGLSINSYLGRLTMVPESLVHVWAFRPYPEGPIPSKGSGEDRGSLLGLLITLYEHRADPGGDDKSGHGESSSGDEGHGGSRNLSNSGLKWLLRFVNALVDGAPSVAAATKSATCGVPIQAAIGAAESDGTSWTINSAIRTKISGMLANLPDLWPNEDMSEVDDDTDRLNAKSKEARKAAQQRVMDMMKKKQSAFAATIAPTESNLEGKMDVDEDEQDLCIICRCDDADGENNGPLGYLGHVQRSRYAHMRSSTEAPKTNPLFSTYRVSGHRGCQLRTTEAMDSEPLVCLPTGSVVTIMSSTVCDAYDILSRRVFVKHVETDPENGDKETKGWASVQSSEGYVILSPLTSLCYTNTRWGNTRPIIRQCGHAAHLRCVETHTLSLHQRAAGEQPYDGRFAANIADGEFLCPLCKQLSNILIPRDDCALNMQKESAKSDQSEIKETDSEIDEWAMLHKRLAKKIKIDSDYFSETGKEALHQFGSKLVQAMTVPWERATMAKARKQSRWHPAIQRWDFEDFQLPDAEGAGGTNIRVPLIKDFLSRMRQLHIAWAAIGHSAAAVECASRSLEEVLSFGTFSQTSDPWNDFNVVCQDSHPMLLELRRSLVATSGFYDLLVEEIDERFSRDDKSPEKSFNFLGSCLADILSGNCHFATGNLRLSVQSKNALVIWSQVFALIAAMPCHVSRDGTLSQRHEARATAAEMWVIQGLGTEIRTDSSEVTQGNTISLFADTPVPLAIQQVHSLTGSTMPRNWGTIFSSFVDAEADAPVPLAIQQVRSLTGSDIPRNWGTVFSSSLFNPNEIVPPFRPGVASTFLYMPLLSWDFNTLSGAIFSAMLARSDETPPSSIELLLAAKLLIIGRVVQAIITPSGYELCEEDDEYEYEEFWSEDEIEKESEALAKLIQFCRSCVQSLSVNPEGNFNPTFGGIEAIKHFSAVGRSILPFARSLVLILRATNSAVRQRGKKCKCEPEKPSRKGQDLDASLVNEQLMTYEDGFLMMRELGIPLPSVIIDETDSSNWIPLIKRWIGASIALELHHGSRGKSLIPLLSPESVRPRRKMSPMTHTLKKAPPNFMEGEVNDSSIMETGANDDGGDEHADLDFRMNNDDVDISLMGEEDDEMIDEFGHTDDLEVIDTGRHSAGTETHDQSSDEESYSNPFDEKQLDFASVSRSAIIPYQPSLLAREEIGPGTRGAPLECSAASTVMRDMSHLGMIHRKNGATKCLVRLPKSFVELYSLVNKVKGRDDTAAMDVDDDGVSSETAICLLTGAVMRSGSPRRLYVRTSRPPGACTLHSRQVGSGIGIFFLVQKCTVLLMHNNKSAYSASLYVDQHGEEDPGLRRGRPLFLNEARYRALEMLWRQQGIPREVAQIRSTSDRVIRDNWY